MQDEEKDNQNRVKKTHNTAGGKRKQQQSKADVPGADQDVPKLCGDAGISGLF